MIVLTADDYALTTRIDDAIVTLAGAGRLSAASAMTNMPGWRAHAHRLTALRHRIALGVHLNLTEGHPLTVDARRALAGPDGKLPPLARLITRSVTGRLDQAAIASECRAQITAFRDATGHLPDMIDGHQHVHTLPVVRSAVLSAIEAFDWSSPPLVRTPANGPRQSRATDDARDPVAAWPKRLVVAALSHGFRDRLEAAGLPTNDTFRGFSAFRAGPRAAAELARAVSHDGPALHLVMCHPAMASAHAITAADPHAARRADEFQALMEMDGLPEKIWHPHRTRAGTINWQAAAASAHLAAEAGL